jgi:hypothetical protein
MIKSTVFAATILTAVAVHAVQTLGIPAMGHADRAVMVEGAGRTIVASPTLDASAVHDVPAVTIVAAAPVAVARPAVAMGSCDAQVLAGTARIAPAGAWATLENSSWQHVQALNVTCR